MKVSAQQKLETRRAIIRSATDLIIEKGFKAATMRAIARAAGVGEATIYNYFPAKEAILFAYYEDRLEESVERLKEIEGFSEFTLQEQLQAFFEAHLELFTPDREFVEETFSIMFFSWSRNFRHLKPIRGRFFEVLEDMFQAAIEVEEIPDMVFLEWVFQCFWDFFVGMVFYWLKDGSDSFEDTTVLLDKSLALACAFLKAGVVDKAFDILSFLFRNHILSRLDFIKEQKAFVKQAKRRFMGGTR